MTHAAPYPIRLWLACLLAAACAGAGAATAPDAAAALAAPLATLAAGGALELGGEPLVSHVAVPRLYEATGRRLLWVDPARRRALLATLAAATEDGLRPADYHLDALTRLAGDPHADAAAFDLLASDGYVLLLYHLYLGKVDPVAIQPDWNFGTRSLRERQALEFVTNALATGTIAESAASLRPKHWLYAHVRGALARYRDMAAHGGWQPVPAGARLDPGGSDARVPALRRRLAVSGDYEGPADGGDRYDAALVDAVKIFQRRHLLTADGTVGTTTLRELNVPVAARVDQLRINLERGRWVLHEIGDEDLVVVDIAGYGVRYVRGGHSIWRGRAIVGQPARQTPEFRAAIDSVVFNPTWTVPPGILAKDVLPAMQHGDDVLRRKQLTVLDRAGQPVEAATIDWSRYTVGNFPYQLRQDAGDGNALGRVKINFPNRYLVYLHDTPTHALFDKDQRNFSSGCIRVDRPEELAELLLADPVRWDAAAIRATIGRGTTRTVRLAHAVPVLLIYWTADEDAEGRVVFKRDVYKRDPPLLRALDGRFSFGSRVRA